MTFEVRMTEKYNNHRDKLDKLHVGTAHSYPRGLQVRAWSFFQFLMGMTVTETSLPY